MPTVGIAPGQRRPAKLVWTGVYHHQAFRAFGVPSPPIRLIDCDGTLVLEELHKDALGGGSWIVVEADGPRATLAANMLAYRDAYDTLRADLRDAVHNQVDEVHLYSRMDEIDGLLERRLRGEKGETHDQ